MSEVTEKRCSKCKIIKSLEKFSKAKCGKYGYRASCKKCSKKERKLLTKKLKIKFKEKGRKNFNKICFRCKKLKNVKYFYKSNSVKDGYRSLCIKCYKKETKNIKYIFISEKKCKICKKIKKVKYFSKNKRYKDRYNYRCKECDKLYFLNPEVKFKRNKKLRERRKIDIKFKLTNNIRRQIHYYIKRKGNIYILEDILGYSLESLKNHIENRFEEGMNWKNLGNKKGKWNIDHIIPISHFRFTSVKDKEFKMCWSLNNLQPLWKEINSTKSAKINFYSEDILEKFGVLDIYKLIKDKINE